MKSISLFVDSIQKLEDEIQSVQQNDFNPTLAILFGSVDCHLDQIPALFNKYEIDVIGCSSAGEICDENIYEKGISVLLMDINRAYYKVGMTYNPKENFEDAGVSIGQQGKEFCDFPSFLVFIGLTGMAEDMIKGITSVVPDRPNIFGGMAGDDFQMLRTFTITNEGIFDNAMATLIFDQEKVEIQGRALCGWQPIGMMNTITKAEGSTVYTINDKPAYEAFEDYFGTFHDSDYGQEAVEIGVAQYPLQIVRGESTVLRAALSVNEEDKSIMLAGPVQTGDQFKFSVAPGFEIIEETVEGFQNYQNGKLEADALILISCKARHMSLGPMVEEEVKGIQNIWNKPMVGFFSYGEIGLSEVGDCLLYNDTCSLVLIKERV